MLEIRRLAGDLSQLRAGFDLYEFCSVQNGMYRKDKRANSGKFQVRKIFQDILMIQKITNIFTLLQVKKLLCIQPLLWCP
jgi:hypothetical protein